MTDLHIPDVSKWQPTVDFSKVGPAVILRAHTGHGADPTFAARLPQARAHQQVRGFYIYLIKDRDAASQGREAAAVIGRLQPGEFIAVDVEEGAGDQSARAQACAAELDKACGGHAWIYSGESFNHDHLAHVTGRRMWLAAYRATEPGSPHALWQHTDAEPHPGIGKCDCSIFHGTIEQLHELVSSPSAYPHPAFFHRTLKLTSPPMVGEDVHQLHRHLNSANKTSTFDHRSVASVKAWQTKEHLQVTGVFDLRMAQAAYWRGWR